MLLGYRQSGDRQLFSQLVQRYERELFSYLRRYLGDAEMAEDAFQAAFLQIHLKSAQFEPGRKFRPWLYTIATNQAIDAQRRNKRHRMMSLDRVGHGDSGDEVGKLGNLLESAEPSPLAELSAAEQRNWIEQSISRLPESMQSVIHLVYYQGLKYREAADVLEVPVGTVKSRLHAAILKLNELWNHDHTA
ncbi:MAG TPA: RNA polymerase sigma factor [Pirellulaceae bacterium]|nr:RNA polymerase sigma factor [Pirellulaceae bacterium]